MHIHGVNFLRFNWDVYVRCVNFGAHAPQNTRWSKFDKLCRGEANGLRLVEADTWHCLGYLAGTDLVKHSWRTRSELCKTKFGDDMEGLSTPLASLPLFFLMKAWVATAIICKWNLLTYDCRHWKFPGVAKIKSSIAQNLVLSLGKLRQWQSVDASC